MEATKFTEVGYVGRDVETIIRDLVEQSIKQTRESAKQKVRMQAEDAAEDRVLDVLLPQARERLLEELAPWGLFERGYLERLLDGRLAGIHTRRGVKIWLLITLEAWLRGVFRA